MDKLEQIVRRLRAEPALSRNRHFDELSRPEARRARRILRRLAGLAADVRNGQAIELRPRRDGYHLTIRFPAVRAHRVAHLTASEHAMLVADGVLTGDPTRADAPSERGSV